MTSVTILLTIESEAILLIWRWLNRLWLLAGRTPYLSYYTSASSGKHKARLTRDRDTAITFDLLTLWTH